MQYDYGHCLRVPNLNNDRSNNYNTKKCYVCTKREYQIGQEKRLHKKDQVKKVKTASRGNILTSEIRLLSEIPDNQLSKM